MRVISFVSQKGGSGKTTLCFSIGVAAYEAGRKVLMLDLDRQASLRDWYADREAEEPEVDTVELPKLEEALGGLEKLRFDYVFIDTPGKDDPANSKAITLSDFCIIPCRPTPGDMKAIRPTIANVDRVGKPTAFVLTQTPPKSFRVTEAKTALSMLGLVATTSIVQRNDHQDAQGAGLGVTEYDPNGKAAEEVRELWQWIEKTLRKVGNGKKAA
jgi:chromosome partitioning protein